MIATGRLAEAETALERTKAVIAGQEAVRAGGYLVWAEGRLHVAAGRHQEAAIAFVQALQLSRGTQGPDNRLLILLDLAESLEADGRQSELKERCAELLAELSPLGQLETVQVVVERFRDLCERLGLDAPHCGCGGICRTL